MAAHLRHALDVVDSPERGYLQGEEPLRRRSIARRGGFVF